MSEASVWLDALPQEVCVRITANVIQYHLEYVPHLARASPALRTAVLNALNNSEYMFNLSTIFDNAPAHVHPTHVSQSQHDVSASEASSDSEHSSASQDQDHDHHASESPEPTQQGPAHQQSPQQPQLPAYDPQLPHLATLPPEFNWAMQQILTAQVGDEASSFTIREVPTEEFFAHTHQDDAHPSQHPTEHSSPNATEHQSEYQSEYKSDHQSDHVCEESSSDNQTQENDSVDAPEHRSSDAEQSAEGSETSEPCKSNTSCEHHTDAEQSPDENPGYVPEPQANFHREIAEVLGKDTRTMLINPKYSALVSQPEFQTCITSPLLEEFSSFVPKDLYESLRVGPNLRSLTLLIEENELPVIPYLQRLASTKLRELALAADSGVCLHQYFTRDPETSSLLSSWFPNVETLDIECNSCRSIEHALVPMWSVIKHFRHLKCVNLREAVPEDDIEDLQRLERVSLLGEDLLDLPARIPDRIVTIVSNIDWYKGIVGKWKVYDDQFERLGNCPRLESLLCCIKPGMERGLLDIMGRLVSLGLAFNQSEVGVDENEGRLAPLRPNDGAILELVQAAPNLKSLQLINMRVNRSELREVLISVGDRLEAFTETIFVESYLEQFLHHKATFAFPKSENKHELDLFISILKTAAVHNPKLKELSIDLRPEWITDINSVRCIVAELQAAIKVLSRRAVNLDYTNLVELFLKLADGEIGMIHLARSMGIPGVVVG